MTHAAITEISHISFQVVIVVLGHATEYCIWRSVACFYSGLSFSILERLRKNYSVVLWDVKETFIYGRAIFPTSCYRLDTFAAFLTVKNRNHIPRFSIRLSLDEILIRALMIQPKNNYFSGSSRQYRFSNIISVCFIWPSFKLITSFIVNSSPLLELLSEKACLFCNKVLTKCCFFKQMYLLLYQSIHEIHTIVIIKGT